MLDSPTTSLTKQGIQKGFPYSGRVVDNNDPDGLGKCRIRIEDLHNDVEDAHLPWCRACGFNQYSGAGPMSGGFSVPEIGTQVRVIFQTDEGYSPEFFNYDATKDTIQEETKEDYPHTHLIYKFITDTKSYYNRLKKIWTWKNVQDFIGLNTRDIEFENGRDVKWKNGHDITGNNSNNIAIDNGNDVVINIGGSHTLTISGSSDHTIGGHLNITVTGPITMTAPLCTHIGNVIILGNLSVLGAGGSGGSVKMKAIMDLDGEFHLNRESLGGDTGGQNGNLP